MSLTFEGYMRKLLSEDYADFTGDKAALEACRHFETRGFGEVVWDGPAWRFMQSTENKTAARDWLAAGAI